MMGSPAYMAPEQVSGAAGELTVAADIYGLGAVMYELLTGQQPFTGNTALETMRKVTDEPVERPTTLIAGIDRDLETICLMCMEKKPANRYAAAADLANDLECWLRSEPISARPVGNPERIRRWCHRNPVLATMTAVCALLLVTGSSVTFLFWRKERHQRIETEEHLYAADMLAVGHAMERFDFGRARSLIQRPANLLLGKGKLPVEFQLITSQLEDLSLQTFRNHKSQIDGLAFLPDGRLVTGSLDGWITLRKPNRWTIDTKFRPTTSLETLSVLEGARRMLVFDDKSKEIRIFDTDSFTELQRIDAEFDRFRQGMMSGLFPDGRRLFYTGSGGLRIVSARGFAVPPVVLSAKPLRSCVKLAPNGKVFSSFAPVGGKEDTTLLVLDDPSGNWESPPGGWSPLWQPVTGIPDLKSGEPHHLAFAPNSSLLAVSTGRDVLLVDVAARKRTHSHQQHPLGHVVEAMAFSSDGSLLASGGTDQTLRIHQVHPWKPLADFTGHNATIQCIAFDDTDRHIVTGAFDGEVKVWSTDAIRRPPNLAFVPELPEACKERFPYGTDAFLTVESGQAENVISLRDLHTGFVIHSIALTSPGIKVTDALLVDKSSRAAVLLTGPGDEMKIEVWNIASGKREIEFPLFKDPNPIALRFDYRVMTRLSGTDQLTCFAGAAGLLPWTRERSSLFIYHFDLSTGLQSRPPAKLDLEIGISGGAFNHAGNVHVLSGHDGNLIVIDLENDEIVTELPEIHYSYVSHVSFSQDDRYMASVGKRRVIVWETTTWTKIGEIPASGQTLKSAAFHPNEPRLAVGGSSLSVAIWDLKHWRQVGALAPANVPGDDVSIFKLQFCGKDGNTLAGWIGGPRILFENAPVVLWRSRVSQHGKNGERGVD
jgi:WD40 repeat protein